MAIGFCYVAQTHEVMGSNPAVEQLQVISKRDPLPILTKSPSIGTLLPPKLVSVGSQKEEMKENRSFRE